MAVPPLVLLEAIGLFPGAQQWIDLAVDQLTRRRDQLGRSGNVAEVGGPGRWTIPLVHRSQDLGAAAALRWKCQINELGQVARVLERPSRALPQRGGRLGTER